MQTYKKLANILLNRVKNNLESFAEQSEILQIEQELSSKSYYQENRLLKTTATYIAFIAQVSTAISSYTYIEKLFAIKITTPLLLIFVVGMFLMLMEVLKYVTLHTALEGFAKVPSKPKYVILAVAMVLSGISIYASVQGGGQLGIDTAKVATTETKHDTEIATIRNEIADIKHRNTWKGSTWLNKQDKKLLLQKEQELTKTKDKKEAELVQVNESNQTNKEQFMYGFAFFDVLFLLCTGYVYWFKRNVLIERLHEKMLENELRNQAYEVRTQHPKGFKNPLGVEEVPSIDEQTTKPTQAAKRIADAQRMIHEVRKRRQKPKNELRTQENEVRNEQENTIIYVEGQQPCQECGTLYKVRRYPDKSTGVLHKFCSTKCRVAANKKKVKVEKVVETVVVPISSERKPFDLWT